MELLIKDAIKNFRIFKYFGGKCSHWNYMLAMILELQHITTTKYNCTVLTAGGVQCCDSDRSVRQLSSLDAVRASKAPKRLY